MLSYGAYGVEEMTIFLEREREGVLANDYVIKDKEPASGLLWLNFDDTVCEHKLKSWNKQANINSIYDCIIGIINFQQGRMCFKLSLGKLIIKQIVIKNLIS